MPTNKYMEESYIGGLKKDEYDPRDYIYQDMFQTTSDDFKLPKSFMLDDVPKARSQHGLGSCVSFAATAFKMMLEKKNNIELSPMFLYYFSRIMDGVPRSKDWGNTIRSSLRALKKYGVCVENLCPYNPKDFDKYPSYEAILEATNHRINEYYKMRECLFDIKRFIYKENLPILFGIDVFESTRTKIVEQTGIVPVPRDNEAVVARHCLLCIGYETVSLKDKLCATLNHSKSSQGYLIALNSWGNFGMNGIIKIPFEFMKLGHAYNFWIMK